MFLDFKSHTEEVRDIDVKGRRVSMYLSVFGNVDKDGDVIHKGAYSKSILERKDEIYFLNHHRWEQPHGKFEELKEDEYGLYAVSTKLLDTTYSSDVLKLYEAGILKEHSVGFKTVKDKLEGSVRHIREIKLYEGSNVTLGANPLTYFDGFKSMDKKSVEKELGVYLKAFRNGTFTDETFGLLEIATKQLMHIAAEMAVNEYKSLQADFNHSKPMDERLKVLTDFNKGF